MTKIKKGDVIISGKFEGDDNITVRTEFQHEHLACGDKINLTMYYKKIKEDKFLIFWEYYVEYDYEGRSELPEANYHNLYIWNQKPTHKDAIDILIMCMNQSICDWMN